MDYQVIIIGSGPGGYVAAIRAAQLGMKTAVVEKAEIGGVCLNWGCIPTKALLKSAHVYEDAKTGNKFGVKAEKVTADFKRVINRSRTVAKQVSKGVEFLFKKNNVTLIQGTGKLKDKNTVIIENSGETQEVTADYIILATGARSRQLPNLPIDGKHIIGYRQALTLEELPESMVVVGSGAIGVELAHFYAIMGTKVTIVELLPRVVPLEDEAVSAEVEKALKRQRIKIYTSSSVEKVETGDKQTVYIKTQEGEITVETDVVLSAVGISANIENLGLEQAGVETERGKIKVDEHYRTSADNIFAIGDIINTPALAHVASAEGIHAVEYIAGLNPEKINYKTIPGGIFTTPEVASVGLREHEAKEQGLDYKTGLFPMSALGKATAIGARDGFVKIIADAKTDQILGAHIVGPSATDMIAEFVVAMNTGATVKQIMHSIHPHPTISEAIMEAAAAVHNEAIHI